jgi:parallel beta-helix repeat protein
MCLILGTIPFASAATIYVKSGSDIQAAINQAHPGDTISVKPGTYQGNLKINTPNLTVMSSTPYKAVIKTKSNGFTINSNYVTIKNFDIRGSGSATGISDPSPFSTIRNNKISKFKTGVFVSGGNEERKASITSNYIFNCGTGVSFWSSNNNKLSGNKISNCEVGLSISDSYGTLIYDNNFNNSLNAVFTYMSTWNTKKTAFKNIVGGPYIGGNYWANPSGTGFSQTHFDTNGDGFAEVPYKLNDVNIDYLPLVTPSKARITASSASKK